VDELEGDGGLDGVVATRASGRARGVEHQENDERPDALAARAHQVARDLLETRFPRRQLGAEPFLDAREILLHGGRDGRQGRRRAPRERISGHGRNE
jgi:hypothetical protein